MYIENPYATPNLDNDTLRVVEQTFRQALWQGILVGFKWGSRIALGLCLVGVLFFAGTLFRDWAIHGNMPEDIRGNLWIVLFSTIGQVVGIYVLCCVIGILAGLMASAGSHITKLFFRRDRPVCQSSES
jgi:hypothetical protein